MSDNDEIDEIVAAIGYAVVKLKNWRAPWDDVWRAILETHPHLRDKPKAVRIMYARMHEEGFVITNEDTGERKRVGRTPTLN